MCLEMDSRNCGGVDCVGSLMFDNCCVCYYSPGDPRRALKQMNFKMHVVQNMECMSKNRNSLQKGAANG